MFIFGILILVALGFLVYVVARNKGDRSQPEREDPIAILKSRYARGEITREEYRSLYEEIK